ncbi:MAG: cytochrome c maturation protein CcmE [Deltaproteobacteria bacterium]|jgi:cytochrome c-type biogenesis protein CcmE|nr:cytochrome c maturation protein CcmE [Deltaproteobacteria bacterium]
MPKKNSKSLYIAALALLLLGVGYLAATGVASSTVYHLQIAEALALPPAKPIPVRLAGAVKAEGISPLAEGIGVRFQIRDHEDPTKSLWAVYRGAVPDLFAPDAAVILEGSYEGPEQEFQASKLTTLCPTKYEKKLEETQQS